MTWRHVFIFVLVVLGIIGLKYSGVFRYLSLPMMQYYADSVSLLVERSYVLSVICFILFYALTIMIAIPGFAPLTMVSGYLFGTILGGIYALSGSFLGSVISYISVKLYLQNYIIRKYQGPIDVFKHYVHRYGVSNVLLLLHFLTIVPFFLINSFAAISDISFKTFLWTTLFGSIPLVFLYSFAGQKLHEISSISDIFSPTIIIIFTLLILVALFPMIFRHFNRENI